MKHSKFIENKIRYCIFFILKELFKKQDYSSEEKLELRDGKVITLLNPAEYSVEYKEILFYEKLLNRLKNILMEIKNESCIHKN